ncbi:uncharacterized protein LOC129572108 [Sitodiplosis mosellana]|uniref:uncharacterized protein LOC129572108 n=1 Tax=Sitodiplosis mosellana TaxID=263140 RepID=UPI0024452C31|nr:uncharacterized protein LOC129572108 [Sitodiplosis mosellana]
MSDFNDEWITQKNPKLEHFTWFTKTHLSADKLQTFLRQNPTICSLSTQFWLLPNETAMMELKLDDLWITTDSLQQHDCEYLNMLHAKGVYKRLHINANATQTVVDRMSSLKSLVRFIGTDIGEMVDLSSLVNLEVFTFINLSGNCANVANKPALAKSLQNLNEVNFAVADIDDILPFVHLSPKLKKVVVFVLPSSKNPNQAIHPVAMNREREKLLAKTLYVSKVTIYIHESKYLATKWKTTEIDLKLIEIKRI